MGYFGTEILKNTYELEENSAYFNVDKLHGEYSQAIQEFENARSDANKTYNFT